MLNGKLAEADKKATGYDALKASEDSLQKQVTLVMHQKEISDNDLKHEISEKQSLQKELEDLKVKMEEAKVQSFMILSSHCSAIWLSRRELQLRN